MHTEVAAGGIITPQIEEVENDVPFLINSSEFRTDSGGCGRWRGGLGGSYVVEYPDQKEVRISTIGQGGKFPPCGVGEARSKLIESKLVCRHILRGDEKIAVGTGSHAILHKGDKFMCDVSGGGGVGDPLERDVETVRIDVLNEFVSVEAAREEYGVVIDPATMEVNEEETARLRGRRDV
jgi:N-methylhydantoinase B